MQQREYPVWMHRSRSERCFQRRLVEPGLARLNGVSWTRSCRVVDLRAPAIDIVVDDDAAGSTASVEPRPFRVPGATRSERLDGLTRGDSPTEPERIKIVAAVIGKEVALLTVRSWPRDDVEAAMERIVSTFEIVARS